MGKGNVKILHIALTHGGGVEVYTRLLLNKTSAEFENVLICPSDYQTDLLMPNIRTYRIDVHREISLKEDLGAVKRVRAILKGEMPDILYCHSSMAGAVGRIAALGLGCKTVYNPHGWSFSMDCHWRKKTVYTAIERVLARVTDRIVAISHHEKQAALQKRICPEKKLRVIYNGVDVDACHSGHKTRKALGYREQDFLVACCGRITQQKDPILFAEVAGAVAKKCPEAKFLWVGDGELRDEFTAALAQNGVMEKTWLPGFVEKPWEVMGAADVAVLFSKWEGFGLVLAEYLAMGLPVVATDVGAVSEIITDGIQGRVIKERDPQILAEVILSYRDRQDKEQLRRVCMEKARQFALENTVLGTIRLYQELAMGEGL